jgi:predicted ArsR family transcriptional regulator
MSVSKMSRPCLENSASSSRNPGERILTTLKLQGPLSASSLGEALGTSGEAARQQLTKLADVGLVSTERLSTGVGRPTQIWSLTPAAEQRFPDAHATLSVELLTLLRSSLGEEALQQIITRREDLTRARYQQAMIGMTTLQDKVQMLADLRSRDGYMAAIEKGKTGAFILIENHCPIRAAARACPSLYQAELRLFQSVLGPDADVERLEHILTGGRRCIYRIQQRRQNRTGRTG